MTPRDREALERIVECADAKGSTHMLNARVQSFRLRAGCPRRRGEAKRRRTRRPRATLRRRLNRSWTKRLPKVGYAASFRAMRCWTEALTAARSRRGLEFAYNALAFPTQHETAPDCLAGRLQSINGSRPVYGMSSASAADPSGAVAGHVRRRAERGISSVEAHLAQAQGDVLDGLHIRRQD